MMDAWDVDLRKERHQEPAENASITTKICIKDEKEPSKASFLLERGNVNVEDCLKWIPEGLVLLSVFVQISPIKINPISWIGNMLMKNTNEKIDEMEETMTEVKETIDMNQIEDLRRHILDFANSCQNGVEHSQEQFNQVFKDNEKYHCLLEKHNLRNGRVDSDFKYIENIYQECLKKHHFKGGK